MQDKMITTLEQNLTKVKSKNLNFAKDLVRNYKKYGGLSSKQWYWVEQFVKEASGNPDPLPAEEVGHLHGLMKLFNTAKLNLKYPKITLDVDGFPLCLALAGPNSQYAGQLNVTDGERFGQNIWYGRVTEGGHWTQSKSVSQDDLIAVRILLREFSENPVSMIKKHAKLTGYCCFCKLPLTDVKSTAAGFGPVCAKNYGLQDEWKAAVAVLPQEDKPKTRTMQLIARGVEQLDNPYYRASKGW